MKPTKAQKYKNRLDKRSRDWGKEKFKPRKYVRPEVPPVPQATAKPWQHVKNDIIDDSEDRGHQDVDNEDARKFMQQREQNHRRNIIEANRTAATKWESFDEEQPSSTSKKQEFGKKDVASGEKDLLWQCRKGEVPTAVEKFTTAERNFYKKRITLSLKTTERAGKLHAAIKDLRSNKNWKRRTAGGIHPLQKTRGNVKEPLEKKGQNGNNPFNKERNE
ncbi:uncharacterized protein LOC128253542 [Drosophila gunungcola]|uniref:Uncharacterized protein n=1 Tax=Drosophila gunungcola TaxID=103775 RepID=A0A9Q0BK76_9MUSC|nr:uncharacterized protein LOC128253542 [Drosophila gunungcola]KAI8034941.1 hypothetical protein M5D96_012288 [Drosophila gunungcola]